MLIPIGCADELDTCEKYIQKKYLDANLEHEKLFNKGKLEEAIAVVEDFIEKDSNNYVAINYLGAYKYSLCKKRGCTLEELKEVYDLYKNQSSFAKIIELEFLIQLRCWQNCQKQNTKMIMK